MTERILVAHPGALGDVLLSFPALALLKEHKGASIALLCKEQIGRMAHQLNVVEGHFPIESARFGRLFSKDMNRDIRDFINQYDTIVLVGFPGDVADHLGQIHNGQTYGITSRPKPGKETHVALHMIKQLQAKGLLSADKNMPCRAHLQFELRSQPLTGDVPEFPAGHLPSQTRKNLLLFGGGPASRAKADRRSHLHLIHPGAGSQRKRWPLENFVGVGVAIQETGSAEVGFLIGPAESDLMPLLQQRVGRRFQIHGVEDLAGAMAFMNAAQCFIGNDSGLTHLAAIMGLHTVAIFGPSSPKRWCPLGGTAKILRGETECAPCFETGEDNCEDPRCLDGVSVDRVLQAVRESTWSTRGYDDTSGQG